MTTRTRRVLPLALAALLPTVLLALGLGALMTPAQAAPAPLRAADGWVDGADEFPCLDDVTCLWIENCELDENQHPIYPNRNGTTSYPAGSYSYADEHQAPPTTPTPTTPAPTTPAPGNGGSNGGGSGSNGGNGGSGSNGGGASNGGGGTTNPTTPTPTAPTGTTTDPVTGLPTDGTAAPAAPVVPVGAPSALAAPTLTVQGKTVTVAWAASPNAEIEQVTGYLIRFTGQAAIELDATTFSHTFENLKPGSYRAAVWAKNAAGEGAGSPPSEPVVVGANPVSVKGTVAVTGDLEPGATVTLTGTGFAKRVEGFAVELHSDPVPLGTVDTDDAGGFTLQVAIPATVPAGDHDVVVLFGGQQVSASPVNVAAAGTAAAATAAPTEAAADVATTGASSSEPVPDQAGAYLLGALAAAGLFALVFRGLRGRRRPVATVAAPTAVAHAP